jgi:hypothetical protein
MTKLMLAPLAAVFCAACASLPLAPRPSLLDGAALSAEPALAPEEAAAFSKQIERDLAARGARVAIVFRTGQPLDELPEDLRYLHGALWVYREVPFVDGTTQRGYVVYRLKPGDGVALPLTESTLEQTWPLDFVRESATDDVGVIVPSPEMQRRILVIVGGPRYAALHNPRYSLIANPHEGINQSESTLMLAVVAAAAWNNDDPDQMTANLRAHFQPETADVSATWRVVAPLADERLRTDDQRGGITTATYRSLAAFMEKHKLLAASYMIKRDTATALSAEAERVAAR